MSIYLNKNTGFIIVIDYSRDELITKIGMDTIKERYLYGNESSPQEAFARASCAFATNQSHAQRLYDYSSKQWFMFATPLLSNGGTERGLPISCFLNHVEDSVDGLVENQSETAFLNRYGGGVGTNFSSVRSTGTATSTGNVTTGAIRFIKVIDSTALAFNQGSTRRGSVAVYMDISHPEIEEFIDIRKPTGDINRRSRYIHNALNVPDAFMEAVLNDSEWPLIDPHTKEVKKVLMARDLWKKILSARMELGEPYLHFTDTSNRALPLSLKLKGLKIRGSNLCNEIMLPTDADRTAVCCLSSVNVAKYDEWKDDPMFIKDLIEMLDNTLQVFINKAPAHMWRAINSAVKERSLGLGAMGFHTYIQSKGVGFETAIALGLTRTIFSKIYHQAKAASGELATERGEPEDMKGSGYRNAHVMAIAPNATSSYLCGNVSPGIEPLNSNCFKADTLSGTFEIRNQVLTEVLEKYGKNDDDTWQYILINKGSVQGLKFLTEQEKDLFKTALEIDQRWIVEHAGARQVFIDQGQSVNLFFKPDVDPNFFSNVHILAWKKGLKGLYYCRSQEKKKSMTVGTSDLEEKVNGSSLVINTEEGCLACEG